MNRSEQVKHAFNDFTNDYDNFMEKTKHNNAKLKTLEKLKSRITGKVLDVATGTGDVALWISKNTFSSVVGIDFSEKMIEHAKTKGDNIDFLVQDIENLKFNNNEFDTVICCLAICWFGNREKCISEMKRVCKSEGNIIFLEEDGNIKSVDNKTDGIMKTFENLENFVSVDKIKKIVDLELIEQTPIEPVDENHGLVGLVFRK